MDLSPESPAKKIKVESPSTGSVADHLQYADNPNIKAESPRPSHIDPSHGSPSPHLAGASPAPKAPETSVQIKGTLESPGTSGALRIPDASRDTSRTSDPPKTSDPSETPTNPDPPSFAAATASETKTQDSTASETKTSGATASETKTSGATASETKTSGSKTSGSTAAETKTSGATAPGPSEDVQEHSPASHPQGPSLINTEILATKLGLSRTAREERLFLFNSLSAETRDYLARVRGPITRAEISQLPSAQHGTYQTVTFSVVYGDDFTSTLQSLMQFLDSPTVAAAKEVSYHIVWTKKWADIPNSDKEQYRQFLQCLERKAGSKVVHCALVNKYDASTMYITAKDELVQLGKEIQSDIDMWPRLRILDYSNSAIRLVPGVRLPDSLQALNLGGGKSLETLSGFKMPDSLQRLDVSHNLIWSIDYVSFPAALKSLDMSHNRIFFLNYVEFPAGLKSLDLSDNCIDNLKHVSFPRGLTSLSVSSNPIECIKGVRFPDSLRYLDVSCIPNESMTGIKFPDHTQSLNLQSSMTTTRGLKLPPFVKHLNLAANGVNSINPLKLPNCIEHLFLANNNIKTLSKASFPAALKELYLGNNLVTSLKNVPFPPTLEVLDMEMDPHLEDNEKYITSLKEVVFPDRLRVLRLGYHSIKTIESLEFPPLLEELGVQYNDLRVFRNIRFGPHLVTLDLSGNPDLGPLDNVLFPRTLRSLRIPSGLVDNLPAVVVERANKKELIIQQSVR